MIETSDNEHAIEPPKIVQPPKPRLPIYSPGSSIDAAKALHRSLHHLSALLAIQSRLHSRRLAPVPPPFHPNPSSQPRFHAWVHNNYHGDFRCDERPESLMVPADTPSVKGLAIYGARSGKTRYFGAWIERSGVFVGWMRIQPQSVGIESDYAVGEVLGRSVFVGIASDVDCHDAIDRFTEALKEAAWDLGVAGG